MSDDFDKFSKKHADREARRRALERLRSEDKWPGDDYRMSSVETDAFLYGDARLHKDEDGGTHYDRGVTPEKARKYADARDRQKKIKRLVGKKIEDYNE